VYRWWLQRFQASVKDHLAALGSAALTMFFARLQERGVSASTLHQAYRTLKTFTRWLRTTGALDRDPLAGMTIKTPATLPKVHTEDELRAVLAAYLQTFVGLLDRSLVLVMADTGLRTGEVLRLLVEDWNQHAHRATQLGQRASRDTPAGR